MGLTWFFVLVPFISAAAGTYFGAYLKKKGENLATHEDIKQVIEQVRTVTTVTKEIESKISNDVWDRQKRWELKREVLFETTKRLAATDDVLLTLYSLRQIEEKEHKDPNDPAWVSTRHDAIAKWSTVSAALSQARELVGIVCELETVRAVNSVGVYAENLAHELANGGESAVFSKTQAERFKLLSDARSAIRKELRVDVHGQSLRRGET